MFDNLKKPTPIWAKNLKAILTSIYSVIVLGQEMNVFDILPDSNAALWIKFGTLAFIILANVYLSNFIDKEKVQENKDRLNEEV